MFLTSNIFAKDYYEAYYEASNRSGTIYYLGEVYEANLKAAKKQFKKENPKQKHHGKLVVKELKEKNTKAAKAEQKDLYFQLSRDPRPGYLTKAEYRFINDHLPTGDPFRNFTTREMEAIEGIDEDED